MITGVLLNMPPKTMDGLKVDRVGANCVPRFAVVAAMQFKQGVHVNNLGNIHKVKNTRLKKHKLENNHNKLSIQKANNILNKQRVDEVGHFRQSAEGANRRVTMRVHRLYVRQDVGVGVLGAEGQAVV